MPDIVLAIIFAVLSLNETVIPVLIAIISSGFLFGLFKVLPERKSILIQASENAVRVVNEAVTSLQKELTESRTEISRLEIELLKERQQRQNVETEIVTLRHKIIRLEAELEIYMRLGNQRGNQGNQGERGERGPAGPSGQGQLGDFND